MVDTAGQSEKLRHTLSYEGRHFGGQIEEKPRAKPGQLATHRCTSGGDLVEMGDLSGKFFRCQNGSIH